MHRHSRIDSRPWRSGSAAYRASCAAGPTRRAVLGGSAAALGSAALGGFGRAAQPEVLRLSTAFGPPIFAADGSGFFNMLMSEAAQRIGVAVEVEAAPPERALVNANGGLVDGDGPRIHALRDIGSYPNLLRVPEVLIVVEFTAFSRARPVSAEDWSSLFPYNVGIVRGWKILEQNITEARSLVRAKTARQLFGLLASERIEVAVIDRLSGLAAARELSIIDIAVADRALARRPMYLHMHKRHAGLIEPLGTVLAQMKADGTYARIESAALGPYLASDVPKARRP